jgi:hypothetical protein
MQVAFKKAFLRDLQQLPPEVRSKAEHIVFLQMPALTEIHGLPDVKKLAGYKNFYRLRIGDIAWDSRWRAKEQLCTESCIEKKYTGTSPKDLMNNSGDI